ncbi:hypothetical protein WN943_008630 [Citrus x changshan-huyou]
MNPDGYALKRRGNENHTVLNRDFPYQFFPMNNDEEACQPETRAIMSWVRQIPFTTSASSNGLPTIWEYNKMSMLNLVASLVKTGVRGRIFSSNSGRTLPGSITIKGINYTVNAGRALVGYYRLLTPGKRYEELVLINIFLTRFCYGLEQFAVVMASIPGYKPKSTIIWLEETATADFILDPDITLQGNTLGSICDCSLMVRQRLSCWSFFGVPH